MSVQPGSVFESLLSDPSLTARLRDLGGEDLITSMRRAADSAALSEAAPDDTGLEVDEAVLLAATNLAIDEGKAGSAGGERLLERCGAVTLNGVRRLRMNDAARGEALRKASASGILATKLADSAAADTARLAALGPDTGADLASAWLRTFLRGEQPPLEQLPVAQLRAAAEAARALEAAGAVVPNPPAVREIERLLDLAELSQPLEILVGKSQDAGPDRFAGRDRELRRLRIFVDVLDAQSGLESFSRAVQRTGRGIARVFGGGSALGLTVVGRGGLGKSTLIAKFALDHFLDARSPLPFVYLDFDRASLQPREPAQLAIEAMRQIGLEFPQFSAELDALRKQFRDWLLERDRPTVQGTDTDQPHGADAVKAPLSNDLQSEFGALMRRIAAAAGSRAFLIVLDTMEIVQSDPAAMRGIQSFVGALCEEPFDRLRLVAAGRASISELNSIKGLDMSAGELTLEPLNLTDAREMVDRLGRDLLGLTWKPEWARAIAGKAGDPPERREPLTLRVSVEFIRAATEDRDRLVADIARLGERAGQDFVGRLYLRRMLDHIRDDDARAVAWPALVARRLTRDLLANVIAPFCKDKHVPDGELSPAKAAAAFDLLAKEVWVVEREGDTLLHRADLRARTLPLMWRYKQQTCSDLTLALRDHFLKAGDLVEAGYYRLLAGEHPMFLLTEYPAELVDKLAPAADDFGAGWGKAMQPYAELVSAYLRSRTGPIMRQAAFALLPPEFAYAHLARAGGALRGLDDTKIQGRLSDHRGKPVVLQRMSEPDRVARQTVLIKTGQWAAIDPDELILPGGHQEASTLAFFVARAAGTCVSDEQAARLASALLAAFTPEAMVQAWRIRAYLAPFLRTADRATFDRCDLDFASILSIAVDATPSALAVVRSAATVAQVSFSRIALQWAQFARLPLLACSTINGEEAMALASLVRSSDFGRFLAQESDGRALAETIEKVGSLESLDARQRRFRLEASIPVNLANWLLTQPRLDDSAETSLRNYFAARQPDWIVPVGYGAEAVSSASGVTGMIQRFFAEKNVAEDSSWTAAFGLKPVWSKSPDYGDGIAVAIRADEAGDLAGLLDLTRTATDGTEAIMGNALAGALRRWRDLIAVQSPIVT